MIFVIINMSRDEYRQSSNNVRRNVTRDTPERDRLKKGVNLFFS